METFSESLKVFSKNHFDKCLLHCGRIKRLYSIFQKIERSKVSFDQVYDLLAAGENFVEERLR